MTSASKVGFVGVLAMFAVATVLSFGTFATVNAQENVGYFEMGGDTGWFDTGGGYAPETGWYDTGDGYTPETGWYDTGDGYTPESDYGCNNECHYEPECGCYKDEYGGEHYSRGSSYGFGGGSSYSTPFKISNPKFPSYPAPRPQPPVRPQPPAVFPPSATSHTNVNTNTCVNHSCNTNVNNIDNSINGSFNQNLAPITPVYTLPPQQLIQYVAPAAGGFCVITASPSTIQNGQAAILNWNSMGPGNAWISDGIGFVAPVGSLAVRPNVSTNYVLTVNGPQGPRTCNVFVNVTGSYVSLSQIPYTGFDLGTLGNAAYWTGLLSFALAAAYLVVYYQGGMGSFVPSFAGMVKLPKLSVAKREEETTETLAAPAMFSQKFVAPVIAPTKVATREIENLPVARTVNAPKDAMTFDAGKIVVSRN